jgi:oxysterol-binding protein-related protein 9/10/11
VCKPYNSVLGEHFRAHWDVVPSVYALDKSTLADPAAEPYTSETASLKSRGSSKSGISSISKPKSPSTAATSLDETNIAAQVSHLNLSTDTTKNDDSVRVIFLTEQVSHHPPVSAYFASCPSRSIEMSGIDQITAKISGTTLRVAPGQLNQGIFIKLTGGYGEGERYQITHPVASVNGILRGSFYITVGETTIITCEGGKPGSKLRTIIEYKEEVRYIITNLIEPF